MAEDKQFYVGQKAFIEKDGKVLLLLLDPDGIKRGDGVIDFPGGRIQEDEANLKEALRREVREETTLEIEIGKPFYTWYREVPPNPKHYEGLSIFLVGYQCTYESGEVILGEGHSRFEWIDKDSYKKYESLSAYYKALEAYF